MALFRFLTRLIAQLGTGLMVFIALTVSWIHACFWWGGYLTMTYTVPRVVALERLHVELPRRSGQSVTIGSSELIQNPSSQAAEAAHVRLTKTADRGHTITNVAAERGLSLNFDKTDAISARLRPLKENDTFTLPGLDVLVVKVTPENVTLRVMDVTIPSATHPVGSNQALAPTHLVDLDIDALCGGWEAQKDWLSQKSGRGRRTCVMLRFGGTLRLPGHEPAVGLPEDVLRIVKVGPVIFLDTGNAAIVKYCSSAGCANAAQHSFPLNSETLGPLKSVVVGRTTYDLSTDNNHLTFTTTRRPHWVQTRDFVPLSSIGVDIVQEKREGRPAIWSSPGLEERKDWFQFLKGPFGAVTKLSAGGTAMGAGLCMIVLALLFGRGLQLRDLQPTLSRPGILVLVTAEMGVALCFALIYPPSMPGYSLIAGRPFLAAAFIMSIVAAGSLAAPAVRSRFDGWVWSIFMAVMTAIAFFILKTEDGPDQMIGVFREPALPTAALIVLFMLTSFRLALDRTHPFVLVLWLSILGLAMIGHLNLFSLTFDGQWARFIQLWERFSLGLAFLPVFVFLFWRISPNAQAQFLEDLFTGRTVVGQWSLIVLTGFTLAAIVVWGAVGGETGVFGLQPTELVKTILIVAFTGLAVTVLRSRLDDSVLVAPERLWIPFLIFLVLAFAFVVLNVIVSDLSPLVVSGLSLLMVMLCFLVLIAIDVYRSIQQSQYATPLMSQRTALATGTRFTPMMDRLTPRHSWVQSEGGDSAWSRKLRWRQLNRKLAARPVELIATVFVLIVVGAITYLAAASANPERLQKGLAVVPETPLERIVSWNDLKTNDRDAFVRSPDLGDQVIQSRIIIHQSGCKVARWTDAIVGDTPLTNKVSHWITQAKYWLQGLPGCGAADSTDPTTATKRENLQSQQEKALNLPAVQDDFVATFLFHTFGRDGALLVICLQITLVLFFWCTAVACIARAYRDRRAFSVFTFLGIAVASFGALLTTQFFLSWGNVLGILPVMGQPMSLMSAGLSHMLFSVVPALICALAAARLLGTPPVEVMLGRGPLLRPATLYGR